MIHIYIYTHTCTYILIYTYISPPIWLGHLPRSVFQLRASKLQALRRDGQRCTCARGEDGGAGGLVGVMGGPISDNVGGTMVNHPPNLDK